MDGTDVDFDLKLDTTTCTCVARTCYQWYKAYYTGSLSPTEKRGKFACNKPTDRSNWRTATENLYQPIPPEKNGEDFCCETPIDTTVSCKNYGCPLNMKLKTNPDDIVIAEGSTTDQKNDTCCDVRKCSEESKPVSYTHLTLPTNREV